MGIGACSSVEGRETLGDRVGQCVLSHLTHLTLPGYLLTLTQLGGREEGEWADSTSLPSLL